MRRALLVGIDDYPTAPLSGCVNDAIKMGEILRTNEDGSPNFECALLLSPDQSVRKPDLRRALEGLLQNPAEVALFHFSGHGTFDNLGGYLVTHDAEQYDEGFEMDKLLLLANDSPIQEVIIILDCCHSGAFGQIPSIGTNNSTAVLREGVSILTSSRWSQPSMEQNGAGVFTSLVYDALSGGAADVCGQITLASVYAYIDQVLGAWDQRPLFKSHVSKLLALRRCEPDVDLRILRKLPEYFPSADHVMALDPSFEPSEEHGNQENEQIFEDLQKLRDSRLLQPVGADHLYYAALNSKACKLTPLGRYYWNLASKNRI